jgi:hypothetical protein
LKDLLAMPEAAELENMHRLLREYGTIPRVPLVFVVHAIVDGLVILSVWRARLPRVTSSTGANVA